MAFIEMTLKRMTLNIGHYQNDIHCNDTYKNDIQHNDIYKNCMMRNDTKKNDTEDMTQAE